MRIISTASQEQTAEHYSKNDSSWRSDRASKHKAHILISNSGYPTQYVVFLSPFGLSGKYLKCHFIGEFSDLDMQNIAT